MSGTQIVELSLNLFGVAISSWGLWLSWRGIRRWPDTNTFKYCLVANSATFLWNLWSLSQLAN
jgi:hypothetical protein